MFGAWRGRVLAGGVDGGLADVAEEHEEVEAVEVGARFHDEDVELDGVAAELGAVEAEFLGGREEARAEHFRVHEVGAVDELGGADGFGAHSRCLPDVHGLPYVGAVTGKKAGEKRQMSGISTPRPPPGTVVSAAIHTGPEGEA